MEGWLLLRDGRSQLNSRKLAHLLVIPLWHSQAAYGKRHEKQDSNSSSSAPNQSTSREQDSPAQPRLGLPWFSRSILQRCLDRDRRPLRRLKLFHFPCHQFLRKLP